MDYRWVDYGDWPEPLHFGTKAALENSISAIKHLMSPLNEDTPAQNNISIERLGLVDDDIFEYKLISEQSWITFGKDSRHNYIIYMIGTYNEFRNQGHASRLLEVLFRMIKKENGTVTVESYTSAGEIWIRGAIEKMAIKYRVRLIK